MWTWAYCCRSTEQKARAVLCTWGIEEGKEKGLEVVNAEHLERGSVSKLYFFSAALTPVPPMRP